MSKSFSEQFAAAWATPSVEGLTALLHDEVVLLQPHRSPIKGKAAAKKDFARLLGLFPAMYGKVDRYLENDSLALIEWRLIIPLRSDSVDIAMVDRFFLSGGLGLERKVYFDQLQLVRGIATDPATVFRFVKYRLGL